MYGVEHIQINGKFNTLEILPRTHFSKLQQIVVFSFQDPLFFHVHFARLIRRLLHVNRQSIFFGLRISTEIKGVSSVDRLGVDSI